MITNKHLDDLEERVRKDWKIWPAQIQALIDALRAHPAVMVSTLPAEKHLCTQCHIGKACTVQNCPHHPKLAPYVP